MDLSACLEGVRDVVVVLSGDGTVRYQSPSVERVLGYDDEGLVGESYVDYVHPEDREAVEALLRRVDRADGTTADGGGPVRYRVRHAEGSWIDVETDGELRHEPETGGTILVSRDVTERLQLERDLERYEVILESLDDAVYAISDDGQIVYVNESYAAMKGVGPEELVGTQIYGWGSGDAGEKIRRAREEMEDSDRDVGVVEFEFSTVDGEKIPVEMRFNTVTHPGNDLERTGVMRDVSERKAREEALRRKNERLEEFASIVSHDLRNPLNVAEARVRMIMQRHDIEDLEKVSAAHARMEALIDDLLTLAREGETVGETTAVDLAAAVESAWDGVDTKDATLVLDTDAVIRADEARLQQLLENLVRNAVEHAGDDVAVTVGDVDGGFYVEDDGPGVPPEEREKVLEPGFSTTSGGTGFGLGIVQGIAEAHGWDLAVEEGTVGGARFQITGVEIADG